MIASVRLPYFRKMKRCLQLFFFLVCEQRQNSSSVNTVRSAISNVSLHLKWSVFLFTPCKLNQNLEHRWGKAKESYIFYSKFAGRNLAVILQKGICVNVRPFESRATLWHPPIHQKPSIFTLLSGFGLGKFLQSLSHLRAAVMAHLSRGKSQGHGVSFYQLYTASQIQTWDMRTSDAIPRFRRQFLQSTGTNWPENASNPAKSAVIVRHLLVFLFTLFVMFDLFSFSFILASSVIPTMTGA